MAIAEALSTLKQALPKSVELVAVSKTKPLADLQEAYAAGQRHFGENKIQEMTQKWEALPKDIFWHMIGHVQTNKVKYMAPYVHLVHGIDRLKLLKEVNKQAHKNNRCIDCLLQMHIAQEDTKFGLDAAELEEIIELYKPGHFTHIRLRGLMGMATFTSDKAQIRSEFTVLKNHFDAYKNEIEAFDTLSMGMSGDYPLAIEMGSTLIRVGSKIFGARNY